MPVPTILLFLKAPIPGLVKTRLARSVGELTACFVYRTLVERQLNALPAGWVLEIHYAPRDAGPGIRSWIHGADRYVPQVEGDLGARLAAGTESVFRRHHGPIFLIGADCPGLDAYTFYTALAALSEGNEAVFGPARDGGYYLLGLERFVPGLFEDIPWGTSDVLARSLREAERASLKTALLDEKEDIDDLESLLRCGSIPPQSVATGSRG